MVTRCLLLLGILTGCASALVAERVQLDEIAVLTEHVDPHGDGCERGRFWYLIFGHNRNQRLVALNRDTLEYRAVPGVASLRGRFRHKAIVNPSDYSGLSLFDPKTENTEPFPFHFDPWPNSLIVHYRGSIFYGSVGFYDGDYRLARYDVHSSTTEYMEPWGYLNDVSDDNRHLLLVEYRKTFLYDMTCDQVVREFPYEGLSKYTMVRFLTNEVFLSPPRLGNLWYLWHIDGRMLARVEFFFRSPYHNAVTIILTEDLTHAIVEFANRGKLGNLRERGTLLLDSTNFRDYLLERGWLFEPREGVLNASRVRMRENPNLQATHLRFLEKGERVEVLDRSGLRMQIGEMNTYWYKVRTADGEEGWSYGAFIDLGEKLDR